ncbi:uncharacterized protein LOC126667187 [Mercurialis annua]|uniref:uncharacterized protein LOC126667187 n=1 Tax=Mercurialis annua TaxID=3986 RepID=UPI00215ED805|nr:uncharacterized protein LOC126667187 [Mercurialis annua]
MIDHNAFHHHKFLHFPQLSLLFSISSFLYSFLSILLFLLSTRVRITCYPRIIYMATIRAKDSLRKEKKVATPSSSPKPAIATHSDHKLKSSTPASSSSAKPVPNYLKPTLSSKSESLKFVKKPNHSNNNEDPAQKQLLRRRSFDRPPSSVRAQTSLISSPEPKERVAASRIPNNRPSSASTAHTTAYYRPVLDRNSKSLKPTVRSPPQQVHRPVANSAGTLLKRSKSLSKNNNSHSSKSPSNSIPPPPDETQDLNLEINQETTNNESLVQESAELEAVNNVEDMDVAEDSQVKDGGDVHHHEDDENIKTAETSIVEEVSSVVSDQVEVNEIELRHEVVHQDENIQEELEHEDQKEERDENQLDDTKLVDNQVITDDRKEEENIVNEKTPEEESEAVVEETKYEELVSEEVKLKNEEPDVQEVVAVENRVEEGNEEVNNNSNNNSNATQNKKQPAAYNDVIEETKNKLLEKRKNKVKALVGAFETVIDYETAAGSNK